MKITIQDIVTLYGRGSRLGSRHCIFPPEELISSDDRLFVLCDGQGSDTAAEKAARLTCEHFSDYLLQQGEAFQSRDLLAEALAHAGRQLEEYAHVWPEYAGMAATLAYLGLTPYGAIIAWAGNSRVLQIREGRVIRQTKDHSLVNALLSYGEISREQVRTHPRKDVLLRVVSDSDPVEPEIMYVDDLMPGDYFLLCTDTVVESLGDHLPELFANSFSPEQLRHDINFYCQKNTDGNYGMILLSLAKVADLEAIGRPESASAPVFDYPEEAPVSARVDGPVSVRGRPVLPVILFFLTLLLAGWWWYTLPAGIEIVRITESGVMIHDDDHKVLINAFPLSDRVRERRQLAPLREKMLWSDRPFDDVELFLVSHRPDVEMDSVRHFLRELMNKRPEVELHPRALWENLSNNLDDLPTLSWNAGELADSTAGFVERLPVSLEQQDRTDANSSVFYLKMRDKTILYAGDPDVEATYLAVFDEHVDYLLVSEWALRNAADRQALKSRFDDRSVIILPTNLPMNNQQKAAIRRAFASARFLGEKRDWVRLR